MSAIISASLPDNASLPKKADNQQNGRSEGGRFEALLKGKTEKPLKDQTEKTAGEDDSPHVAMDLLNKIDKPGTAVDKTGADKLDAPRFPRTSQQAGLLGFERTLRHASSEASTDWANRPDASVEADVSPRDAARSAASIEPLLDEAKTRAQEHAASSVPKTAMTLPHPQTPVASSVPKKAMALPHPQTPAALSVPEKAASAADIPAAILKGTGLPEPSARSASEPAMRAEFSLTRSDLGTDAASPAIGIAARADLVSMRTDFQPVGMTKNGAKAAGVSLPAMVRRIDGAMRAETTQAGAENGAVAGEDDTVDLQPKAKVEAGLAKGEIVPERSDRQAASDIIAAKRSENASRTESITAQPKTIEKTIDPDAGFGREIGTIIGNTLGEPGERQGLTPRGAATASDSYTPAGEQVRLQAGGAALKTLRIQLQPAHFGKLDVLMKVVAGQMTLELSVSEPETLMRIQDDREGLKAAMASAGFDLDEAAVTITLRDGASQPRGGAAVPEQIGAGRNDQMASNGGETGQSRGESHERRGQSSSGNGNAQGSRTLEPEGGLERGRQIGSQVYL